MTDPGSEYSRRIKRASDAIRRGERRHELIANARLAVAAAMAACLWLSLGSGAISPAWLIAPAAAFLVLVVTHARVLGGHERFARARRFYERGLDRIGGRWAGSGPDGARFLDDHKYARDLDLFGRGSLFQLLSIARTEAGEDALAGWLLGPAPIAEVGARQAAVRELAGEIVFRETLASVAAEAHVGRTSALGQWAARSSVGLQRGAGIAFLVVGVLTSVMLMLAFVGRVPGSAAAAAIAVDVAVAWHWRRRVAEVIHGVDAASDDLAIFRELLEKVEGATFAAPWLARVRERLVVDGEPPSRRISRLETLVSLLNQTQHNPFVRVIATPLLADGQLAVAIDRWHAAHGGHLAGWLEAIGELEAVSSIATYAYEHPADPFPTVREHGALGALDALIWADGLAHPLLPDASAVRNDLRVGGAAPHVYLVSGSNMSGKSTLLRAVGVNVVLALAGAPVRATAMTLTPLAIGATLHVVDSLQEGYSRFYAEILRIGSIVELSRGRTPVLFLLDEILHGTNSYDRRIGAEAIVGALVAAGAIGLVTTHDLALAELVAALGPRAANVHFEDQLVDQHIVFDYRLRAGVVERSNALALMRAIGIDV
ncbi:MAG: hypothetical protein A3H97_22375 [Acidobacteria bacterium RIFCSPLOWO2_02_FULL_65_29]|nr:MAG: hypothetical protein A3H97_22375 [Acidobacteria bacterium RIFCSPLOWO2_02_FULL_65_29]